MVSSLGLLEEGLAGVVVAAGWSVGEDTWSLEDGLLFPEMDLKRRLRTGSLEEGWREWWVIEVAPAAVAMAAGERREVEAMKDYPFEKTEMRRGS